MGLNVCYLCGSAAEFVNHLFVDCSFGRKVQREIAHLLKIHPTWDGPGLSTNMWHWCTRVYGFLYLPTFLCWSLWKMRNMVIFYDIKPQSSQVCISVNTLLKEFLVLITRSKLRIVSDPVVLNYPIGFIDGAPASGSCGAGFFCAMDCPIFFMLRWDVVKALTHVQNCWLYGGSLILLRGWDYLLLIYMVIL